MSNKKKDIQDIKDIKDIFESHQMKESYRKSSIVGEELRKKLSEVSLTYYTMMDRLGITPRDAVINMVYEFCLSASHILIASSPESTKKEAIEALFEAVIKDAFNDSWKNVQ